MKIIVLLMLISAIVGVSQVLGRRQTKPAMPPADSVPAEI